MKKFFAIVLTLALALSLSVTAFATEEDHTITSGTNGSPNPSTATTSVTFGVDPTYTITIPGNVQVEFNATSTKFGAIELAAAQIVPGYAVKVELDASGKLKNEADQTKTIAYTVNSEDGAFSSQEYQNEGDSTDLTINITQAAWNAAYAGNYSDTVTFTVSYIDTTTA